MKTEQTMELDLNIEDRDGVGLVTLAGRLNATNAYDFREGLIKWNKKGVHFVFDLSKLEFIDSTGLGAIISCLKSVRERKKELYLVSLQPKVKLVFEITQAHKIFDIYDDLETALSSL